jgi:hypothetical protein
MQVECADAADGVSVAVRCFDDECVRVRVCNSVSERCPLVPTERSTRYPS